MSSNCHQCVNKGKVNGLSQETFCQSCVWYGSSWKKNHFKKGDPNTPVIGITSRQTFYAVKHTEYLTDYEIMHMFGPAKLIDIVDYDCEPDGSVHYWTVYVEEE